MKVRLFSIITSICILLCGCGNGDVDYSGQMQITNSSTQSELENNEDDQDVKDADFVEDDDTSVDDQELKDEGSEEHLTVDNCEEFANILTIHDNHDPSYKDFAEKYKNRIIEFDGCITYLTNHDDLKTRYDLLISAGDYIDENTSNPGPNFKFNNVNTLNMGIEDLFLPPFVRIGSNIHVIAKVYDVNLDTGIFELEPISITER